MEGLPRFRLFRDPVGEKSFARSWRKCRVCRRRRGWVYAAGMFGEGKLNAKICPWCIADGTAAEKLGVTFNDGEIYPSRPGTPQLSEADREEVEQRTPGFTTWQDHGWQMCCGRACEYLGEAREGDLLAGGRWEGAAASVLEGVSEWSEEERMGLLRRIGRARPQPDDPAAYVFRCVECGGLKGFWDCS